MALVVETPWAKIFVDPGASFAPRRYGLPPHPLELKRLEESIEKIRQELADSDIVIITHYHYDHYLYRSEHAELYHGKLLLLKHPESSINVSQRIRAHRFLKVLSSIGAPKRVEYADGRSFELGRNLRIAFSPPVPHGPPGTKLGWVLMALIDVEGFRIVHASDVQGPMSEDALNVIISWSPHMVFISGPPTYFEDFKVPKELIDYGLENLVKLANSVPEVVVDHHFARDLRFTEHLASLRSRVHGELKCAATYMGAPVEPLEALRKKLWEEGGGTD